MVLEPLLLVMEGLKMMELEKGQCLEDLDPIIEVK